MDFRECVCRKYLLLFEVDMVRDRNSIIIIITTQVLLYFKPYTLESVKQKYPGNTHSVALYLHPTRPNSLSEKQQQKQRHCTRYKQYNRNATTKHADTTS